jgi:hypothetical protein
VPTVSLSKGNEALATFVPKHKAHALEALKQCKLAHTAKFGIVTEHQGQAVIRNTAAQMVDMDTSINRRSARRLSKIAQSGRWWRHNHLDRDLSGCLKRDVVIRFARQPLGKETVGYARWGLYQTGTFLLRETLRRMTISSWSLHSIPDPSVRLFQWLFVLTTVMMMGSLLIMRHSQHARILHHEVNIVVDRSKT